MSRSSKTVITTILLAFAFVEWPGIYYFTSGFIKLFSFVIIALPGFILSIILTIKIIRYKNTNTAYHIGGLIISTLIGISAIADFGGGMQYADFYLRLHERNAVVEDFKSGKLKDSHLPGFYLLPISNDGNDVEIWDNAHGIVTIGFYIDRGFLDHASLFIYTNSPGQIADFDWDTNHKSGDTSIIKMSANWYRVGF